MTRRIAIWTLVAIASLSGAPAFAHSGPPYPLVSEQPSGPYVLSIWTDPDTTDDGSPEGKFWITLHPADAAPTLPADTTVVFAIAPGDRPGPEQTVRVTPAGGLLSNQLVALNMDHEGPFRVRLTIDGALGRAAFEGDVDATYDLRPAPMLLLLYVLPFAIVAFLWVKLMLRRRRVPRSVDPA